jgi:hypothetical protein
LVIRLTPIPTGWGSISYSNLSPNLVHSMKFKGTVGIVTGAARGIGRAIALGITEQRARIAIPEVLTGEGQHTVGAIWDVGGSVERGFRQMPMLTAFGVNCIMGGLIYSLTRSASQHVIAGISPWRPISVRSRYARTARPLSPSLASLGHLSLIRSRGAV